MSKDVRGRFHTRESALRSIGYSGAQVDRMQKVIHLGKHQGVGIKTWGCIDYLCNVQNYMVIREM